MIKSMTGFGKSNITINSREYQVEIKSINHRYSDINIKMPKTISYLEEDVKKEILTYITRGKIDINISYSNTSKDANQVIINKEIAKLYIEQLRQLAEETIREKALILLKDEVPHGIFVKCEKCKFKKSKTGEDMYQIEATIYTLRESHKGIIIGKNGSMLKRIGTMARKDMEKNFGTKVNLKTWVKVKEDWQNNEKFFM